MHTPLTPSGQLDNPHDRGLAPSRLPVTAQWVLVGLFVIAVVVATLFAVTEHWRRATFTLGVSMIYLAVLRLVCDSKVMGLLAVRSRRFDAFYCTVLGGTMAFLAASVDSLGS